MTDLKAIVVDDEPLARRRLRTLVDRARGVTWVGEAATGAAALAEVERARPDLVFLDVEMPGLTGLQVMERLEPDVLVVFTTAYDRYAVAAFELHAADYLLKPFGAERLQAAVDRARSLRQGGEGRVRRLFVRERGRILPIPVARVVRLEADGDYVHVHAGERTHLVTGTLQDLHARLDPERFVRVHRSHVVNLDHVSALERAPGGRLKVRFRDGSAVMASRTRSRELRGLAL